MSINTAPAAPAAPVKGAKGAPVAPPPPAENALVEVIFPFSSLLAIKGASVDFNHTLDDPALSALGIAGKHGCE